MGSESKVDLRRSAKRRQRPQTNADRPKHNVCSDERQALGHRTGAAKRRKTERRTWTSPATASGAWHAAAIVTTVRCVAWEDATTTTAFGRAMRGNRLRSLRRRHTSVTSPTPPLRRAGRARARARLCAVFPLRIRGRVSMRPPKPRRALHYLGTRGQYAHPPGHYAHPPGRCGNNRYRCVKAVSERRQHPLRQPTARLARPPGAATTSAA